MSSLPPIPRPAALRWRDLTVRGGPFVACLAVLGVVAMLWSRQLLPSNFVGEVQSSFATVNSTADARLVELYVDQFVHVTNGQPVVTLRARSADVVEANLAAIKADLEVLRIRMGQDQERNDLNYQQTRVDLLLRKLELAAARVRLVQAQSEFERVRKLHEEQIIPAGIKDRDTTGVEVALRDRDALQVEVDQKTQLVAQLEESLTKLRPPARQGDNPALNRVIDDAIAAQEHVVEETEGPTVLRAPIDGMVMKVFRRAGELVAAREPLLEISAENPDRIIGFIRQPIAFQPQTNEIVLVRPRGVRREPGEARVLRVGSRLELFTQPLRVRGFDASLERGLPVLLTCPQELTLHPGELVDLIPTHRQ